jgi:FkbM family methyltransferase
MSQEKAPSDTDPLGNVAGTASVTALRDCRHGKMLFLKGDSYIGRSLDLYGEFSELEADVFARLVRLGDVVVEVGANIGAHTVHIAKLVGPQGRVLAFEPQRIIFEILCANMVLNEHFHVFPYHAAFGKEAGTLKVPMLDYAADNNFGGLSLNAAGIGEEVPVRTLDSTPLSKLRLLKVDVEGMEVEVLSGGREVIRTLRPILYVENDREQRSEELISLIEELGYKQWWHLPPLFNPNNFAHNPENVFARTVSINLLCVPKEWKTNIVGFRPVSGPKDWPPTVVRSE